MLSINELCMAILNCDDQIDTCDYKIKKFKSTVFESDYQCYLVTLKADRMETEKGVLPDLFVAKVTHQNESDILYQLKKLAVNVPTIYGVIKLSERTSGILLFEEFIPGKEICEIDDNEYWCKAAETIADMQLSFFKAGIKANFASEKTLEKIKNAARIAEFGTLYKKGYEYAFDQLTKCQTTFIHGDMFPTNVIASNEKIYLIDLFDAGRGPYIMDLGRLTESLSVETGRYFCPCREAVYETYYNKMKSFLKRSFDEFMQDMYAAQFIEGASNLVMFLGDSCLADSEKLYMEIMFREMNEIVDKLSGQN